MPMPFLLVNGGMKALRWLSFRMSPPTSRQRALCRIWEKIEALELTLRENGGVLDAADLEAIERLFDGLFRGLKLRLASETAER
jgi:hypothetical protein